MASLSFYVFIAFASSFFVWLSEYGTTRKDKSFLLFVGFLFIFLPSALRYGVGTDFFSYIEIAEHSNFQFRHEYLFSLISSILNFLELHPQWSIAIMAMIFFFTVFLCLPDKNPLLLFLPIVLLLWFDSFNAVRQVIAIGFSLLACKNYLNNNIVRFTFFIIIGALFHKSILLLLPLGYMALIPLPRLVQEHILPVLAVLFLCLLYFKADVLFPATEQLLIYGGFERYAAYFHSAKHFVPRTAGTSLMVAVKLLFCAYVILSSKYLIQDNIRNKLLIYITLCFAASSVLASQIIILGRAQMIFLAGPIWAVYILYSLKAHANLNKQVSLLFILLLCAAFVKDSLGIPTDGRNPMRNPYQSVLLL